jgi:flagellin
MSTSKYKGKDIFVTTAGSEYVSMGGRDAEMTFGIGSISYAELHDGNNNSTTDMVHKPSVAVTDTTSNLNALVANTTYEITEVATATSGDATAMATLVSGTDLTTAGQAVVGRTFRVGASAVTLDNSRVLGVKLATSVLTADIEAVQAKVNTARVQAGSQYAAIESAVNYTTDLTAQYELGFNTVNDVNFSMETAHLAKNQILQQAATAMLAQANQGQQGLLQLIQS